MTSATLEPNTTRLEAVSLTVDASDTAVIKVCAADGWSAEVVVSASERS